MADFVAVLKKTLDGLSDTSPPMREKVYDRARGTIASKLTAMNPPLPAAVVERQKKALEDAIAEIERGFPKPARGGPDPLGELEDVFASLRNPVPIPPAGLASSRSAPPAPPPPIPPARAAGADVRSSPVEQADAAGSQAGDVAPDDDRDRHRDGDIGPYETTEVGETIAIDSMRKRRAGRGWLVAAIMLLALVAAGGYGLWRERDRVAEILARYGLTGSETTTAAQPAPASTTPAEEPATPPPAAIAAAPAPTEPAPVEAAPPATVEPALQKFTQKLNADGSEVDAGPATVAEIVGEGTTVAAATTPPEPPPQTLASADLPPVETPTPPPALVPGATDAPPAAEPAPAVAAATPPVDAQVLPPVGAPQDATTDVRTPPPASADTAAPPLSAAPPATDAATPPAAAPPAATDTATPPALTGQQQAQSVPVGQRAIFYEERTNVAEASAEPGSIVWSLVQESPGNNLPPEPVIRAEATIPGKDVQLRMTIRRNADQTLPASHIVEMIFLTPQGFEGGGIDNVLRLSLKGSEQEAGSPLLGIPAKIADGFFLIALNDTQREIESNMALLRGESWIDVPVQYKNGRRALFTMEKGIPGAKVFDEALKAWQVARAG